MTRRELIAAATATVAHAAPPAEKALSGDVFFSSIRELQAGLAKKEYSSVELTEAFCNRLERLGPGYNALALMLRKPALELAKDADADRKRGRTRGALQGIPYGAKDLFALDGVLTTWGAKPYAAQKFDYTATALTRLEKKQAILIGKLAMVELAGGPSYNSAAASLTGPCLNPWDTTRWSGGSSSGSGAAVAAGLVPFALGTETSGSILTPSAYCGVTGLRTTSGLVSRYGAMALSPSLDKIGPMCRTAEDCGLVLEALAGADSKDPLSAGKSFYFAPQFARPLKEIRVGYAPVDFEGFAEPSAVAAFREALSVVRAMGVKLVEARIPELPYGPTVRTLIMGEAAHEFRELIESGRVDELADKQQIEGLKNALKITAADYLKALSTQAKIRDEFRKFYFEQCDVLLAPARTGPAISATLPFNAPGPKRDLPKERGNGGVIPAGNLAGLPAISLPCGFAEGEKPLPVAIQFMGRQWSENMLVALGMEFQKRTDWHRRRPPVA